LPTATAAGQIVTSTASGTTYAVQGQVFYSQTGDTVSSIEAECSSLCTYIVTDPQTFTLATNHTLSSNVNPLFYAGGMWTVNGSSYTLTISGQVQGTLNQHFAGSATIAGLSGAVPVEWFGAVGYTTKSASGGGSDYTPQVQATLNAITGGGWAQLQLLYYNVSSGLTITTSSVGIHGMQGRDSYPANARISSLISTNASQNILTVHGTSGTDIVWNTFKDFSIERLVLPTGTVPTTGVGMYMQYTGGLQLDSIVSNDSLDDFYLNADPSDGFGYCRNSQGENGLLSVNTYTNQTINIWDIDSSNGRAMNTAFFNACGGTVNNTATGSGVTSTIFYIHGSALNDLDFLYPGGRSTSYGFNIVYTGSGAEDSEADIHIAQPILDAVTVSDVKVSGLNYLGGMPTVTIQDGYLNSNIPNMKFIDCENSNGVSVLNNQLIGLAEVTGNVGIYENGCANGIVSNNKMQGFASGTGISFVSTTKSTVTGNNISGTSTSPVSIGYSFDSASLANDVGLNTCGANVTTCVSGTPVGVTPTFLASGSTINGSPIGAGSSGTVTNTTGSLTSGYLTQGNGGVDIKPVPTVSTFSYGSGGASSTGLTILGPSGGGLPANFASVVGQQAAITNNTVYNGSNWVYQVNGGASGFRLPGNPALPGYFQLVTCPIGTAGGTAAVDTTCVSQWTQYSFGGQQTWFNSQQAGPTFPTNAALVLNPTYNWMVDFSGNDTAASYTATGLSSYSGNLASIGSGGALSNSGIVASSVLTSLSGALLATGATTGATSQAQAFTDGVIPSNLTVGYIPYPESSDKKLVNSPLYTNGTNVGIGATSLQAVLSLRATGGYTSPVIELEQDNAANSGYRLGIDDALNGDLVFSRLLGGTAVPSVAFGRGTSGVLIGTDYAGSYSSPTNGLVVEGNVGIGTTSPSALLSVGSTSQFQVSSSGVMSAAYGSTAANSGGTQKAICLADGTGGCLTSSGVSGMTANYIPLAATATTIAGNSHLDDGVTVSGAIGSSEPLVLDYSSATHVYAELYNATGHAWFLNSTGSSGYASAPANSLSFQDATGTSTPLYLTSSSVVALQPVSMPTGSTVNSTNICLADGTGCPSLNNTIQGGIILTAATSDSTTLTYSSAYNAASCVFSPSNSTATTLTILPYLTSTSSTGSVTVTINHAATVGTGATYNIVCSLWHSV
jgi:hypothetical protein